LQSGPERGIPEHCAKALSQTGLLFRIPFQGATADGFPAEMVELRAIRGGVGGQI
jgi:hypothetical protein